MTLLQKIFVIINCYAIPFCSFFILFIFVFYTPSRIFDAKEIVELNNTYYLKPLKKIISSSLKQSNLSTLFGYYSGFYGGHKYTSCFYLFSGTCKDDLNKMIYCPDGDEDRELLNNKSCFNYYAISKFNYTRFYNTYYYAEKMDKSYDELLKSTVKKGNNCPKTKKSCGLLNKESKLCLPTTEECPINDIIINNQSSYSENNIYYISVKFGNDYIHFTNQQISNQIIFDLPISIENPLSRIEIEDKFGQTFDLNYYEKQSYYNGNMDDINAYKKIYKTNFTLRELYKNYTILDTILKEPYYETKYLNSNIFIYKRYPIPLDGVEKEEILKLNDTFFNAYVHLFFCAIPLSFSPPCSFQFLSKNSNICKTISYIFITAIDVFIIILFIMDSEVILHSGPLKYYQYKNKSRIALLSAYIAYLVIGIYHNLSTIFIWGRLFKEQLIGNEMIESNEAKETPLPENNTQLLPM